MEGMSTYSIRIRDTLKYVLEDSELAGSFNPYGPKRNGTFLRLSQFHPLISVYQSHYSHLKLPCSIKT